MHKHFFVHVIGDESQGIEICSHDGLPEEIANLLGSDDPARRTEGLKALLELEPEIAAEFSGKAAEDLAVLSAEAPDNLEETGLSLGELLAD